MLAFVCQNKATAVIQPPFFEENLAVKSTNLQLQCVNLCDYSDFSLWESMYKIWQASLHVKEKTKNLTFWVNGAFSIAVYCVGVFIFAHTCSKIYPHFKVHQLSISVVTKDPHEFCC